MDVILDTNALSAWLDGEPLLLPVLNEVDTFFLSPIVLGEYRFGIAASKYRERYETVLGEILNEIDVLPMNDPVAKKYADIRRELKEMGTPIPWHDIWIAAQARCFGLKVLSRDRHFDFVSGLKRVSW